MGTIRNFFIVFLILSLSLGSACSRVVRERIDCNPDLSPSKVLDVPPLYQMAFGCGPASLAMVLNYHGINVSLDKTTKELFTPSLSGTLITDMRKFASRYFHSARIEKSNPCSVMEAISKGNPVILFVDLGTSIVSTPHYIVIVGYDIDKQELVFHDGSSEFLKTPIGDIYENWEKTGFLALFIDPNRTGFSAPSGYPVCLM